VTAPPIPLVDLGRQHRRLLPELREAFERVALSGRLVLGPEVDALERELEATLGAPHAVALSSGSDALVVALTVAGVRAGDTVLTGASGFVATPEAILRVGARPRFIDVDPATQNLDPAALEATLGSRGEPAPSAVLVTHLFGRPAELDRILALTEPRGLALVEDGAQALGARPGGATLGARSSGATVSFFPAKLLGALGDGGLYLTGDPSQAGRARRLRQHGLLDAGVHGEVGGNYRLDALQAAMLRVKLRHLPEVLAARRRVAERYLRELAGVGLGLPELPEGAVASSFVVRVGEGLRDGVRARLAAAGVETAVYYPRPLPEQPAFAAFAAGAPFPGAERASREALALPLFPEITLEEQDRVVDALRSALREAAAISAPEGTGSGVTPPGS